MTGPERDRRALRMGAQMDAEGFGNCTFHGECQAVCPKEISIDTIARMNSDYVRARFKLGPEGSGGGGRGGGGG